MLLSNADAAASRQSLKRLDQVLADHNRQASRGYNLAYSVGIVAAAASQQLSLDALLQVADGRMYAHKQGRQAAASTLTGQGL